MRRLLVAAVAGLVLVGCGDDGNDTEARCRQALETIEREENLKPAWRRDLIDNVTHSTTCARYYGSTPP